MTDKLSYHRHLETIADADVSYVRAKDTQYAGSWKKRGGVGAWFTIVRPWDRLENMVTHPRTSTHDEVTRTAQPHDIFEVIAAQGLEGPDGSVIACVRDLRRYLLLVEAHMTEELAGETAPQLPLEALDYAQVEQRVLAHMRSGAGGPTEDIYQRLAEESGITRQQAKERAYRAVYGGQEVPDIVCDEFGPAAPGGTSRRATPADGSQHASLYPWVVRPEQVPAGCDEAWHDGPQRALEPHLTPIAHGRLPRGVSNLYDPVYLSEFRMGNIVLIAGADVPGPVRSEHVDNLLPHAYWLRVADAPPAERERWPTLAVEKNFKEWRDLGAFNQLYDWHESQSKFIIRQKHEAWTR